VVDVKEVVDATAEAAKGPVACPQQPLDLTESVIVERAVDFVDAERGNQMARLGD
jgi:hypothetical protein